MAKTLVLNRINGRNHQFNLPCSAEAAGTFASEFLDGEYQILKEGQTVGEDTETTANRVSVMCKNNSTGRKTYINMLTKSNVDEDEIFSVLIGLTINDVVVDECFMMSMRSETF